MEEACSTRLFLFVAENELADFSEFPTPSSIYMVDIIIIIK
jgi:hypothetical protein